MKLRDKLVVPPRKPVTLADWDPGDTHGFDKEPAIEKIETSIARLDELQYLMYAEHRRALLVVLQGMDAAGKDGTIRHVMRGFNPQGCRVTAFKTPTAEEADHDFLWRVHRAVPPRGDIAIFNRSHYEDVLIARVRKLVPKDMVSPLRRDQPVRAAAGRERRRRREVPPAHQQGRAATPVRGAAARSREAMEALARRLRGPKELGRVRRGVRRGPGPLQHAGRAVVHRAGEQEVVPQPRGVAHSRRDARGPRHAIPQAVVRRIGDRVGLTGSTDPLS